MLRSLILAALVGIGIVGLGLAMGRRPGHRAVAPVLAGAATAFAAFLMVDCRQCASGPLFVGALASLPFALVGWGMLIGDRAGLTAGAWLLVQLSAGLQLAWAMLVTVTATFSGACPCRALGWGDPVRPLAAVGTDRLVGPLLVAVALVTLSLGLRARRRATSARP